MRTFTLAGVRIEDSWVEAVEPFAFASASVQIPFLVRAAVLLFRAHTLAGIIILNVGIWTIYFTASTHASTSIEELPLRTRSNFAAVTVTPDLRMNDAICDLIYSGVWIENSKITNFLLVRELAWLPVAEGAAVSPFIGTRSCVYTLSVVNNVGAALALTLELIDYTQLLYSDRDVSDQPPQVEPEEREEEEEEEGEV